MSVSVNFSECFVFHECILGRCFCVSTPVRTRKVVNLSCEFLADSSWNQRMLSLEVL